MATFTAKPSYSSRLKVKPRVLTAKFGEGYEQSVSDGINDSPRHFELQFNVLTESVGNSIEDFFKDNATAITPFDWTPPTGAAGRFKCNEHTRTYSSGFSSNINCTFFEVFF